MIQIFRSLLAAGIVASSTVLALSTSAFASTSCTPSGNYEVLYPKDNFVISNNPFGDKGSTSSGTCVVSQSIYNSNNQEWYAQWKQSSGATYDVFAYPEIIIDNTYSATNLPNKISAISTIPSTWNYTLDDGTTDGYDVAYDLWVYYGSGATGTPVAEIMMWTAADFDQSGTYIATYTVNGNSYKLYQTLPQDYSWTTHPVYSFCATSKLSDVSGDLKNFLNILVSKGYIGTANYLTSIDAGVEIRGSSGTGSLSTWDYDTYVTK